jgi:hypothetical protein
MQLDIFGPSGDFFIEIRSELTYFASRLAGRDPPASNKLNLARAFRVGSALDRSGSRGSTYLLLTPRISNDVGSRSAS